MAHPPSQFLSQVVDHQLATLPLEKFSFAVSTLGTGNHQWVHDNRADKLFLVFQQTRQSQGGNVAENPLVMSVSAGTQILERHDLRKLRAMVLDFEIQCQQRLVDRTLGLPVHIMIKFPCIALRYLTSATLLRRIQMRFKTEADYQRVVDIFEGLKLPIHNAMKNNSPVAPIRPLRPASANLIQIWAGSNTRDQLPASESSKVCETRASSTVNDICDTLRRPHLPEESPFFKRSHTASSDIVRSGSAWSLDGSRTSGTVSSMSFGEPLVRPNSLFDDAAPIATSQLERTTRPSLLHAPELDRDHISQRDLSHCQDRNLVFTRNGALSEAFAPPLPSSTAIPPHVLFPSPRHEIGPVRRATAGYENPLVDRFEVDKQITKRMSLVPEFLRPLSAPVPSTPENLSQLLPPRRELPFPKARVSIKSCVPPSDLPPSSEVSQRAGERQIGGNTKCIAPGNTTPAFPRIMKRVAQRQRSCAEQTTQREISDTVAEGTPNVDGRDGGLEVVAEREEEPSPLAAKNAALSRPSTVPSLQSKVMATVPRKRGRDTGSDTVPVSKQARIMVDKATQTQTGSGRDHTAPLALSSGTERSQSATSDMATQPPESFMGDIEAFVSKHKHRPAPEELWQRPGYFEASPEERQAIINDFICENLDNEDFLKLCEDTENVWQRIGLEI